MAVDVGSAVGYLDLDISGFLAGLRSAQAEADKTTKNMATTIGGNLQNAGSKLSSAGSTLTKSVTLPIVGLGASIIKSTADFDSSMSKVSAISGASGKDLSSLADKAKEMGAKTKFSASEAAEAFQYMAMAGWKTDDMLNSIDGVMNLAAASGEELGTVSDIVTDAMTAFGLSANGTSKVLKDGVTTEVSNCTRFVDALAAASNSSNTNVSMLGESFKYVAPVAGALGYSVEDTAVALGLMANQGIKSSSAGTALRTVLTNMSKPTDDMKAAMDTLGVSLTDDEGNMLSLMDVMKNLRKGFGGGRMDAKDFQKSLEEIQTAYEDGSITQGAYESSLEKLTVQMYGAEGAEKAKLAAMLAGKTGMAGLLAIVNTTDEDFQSLTDSIYDCSGTSQEMADIMLNNLNGRLTILKSSLEGVALQLGDILMPYIEKAVAKVQELTNKFASLPKKQQENIVKFAAIAAAVGPVLFATGKLITSVGTIITTFGKIPGAIKLAKTGFTTLSTSLVNIKEGFVLAKAGFPALGGEASKLGVALAGVTGPMIAIVAAIGVLIAAFVNLWKNNEEFRNKIIGIWNQIKETVGEFVTGLVDRFKEFGGKFSGVIDVLKKVWDGFCNMLAPVFTGVFQNIADTLKGLSDMVMGVVDVILGILSGDGQQIIDGVKEICSGVWNIIKSLFKNGWESIKGIYSTVLGWFGTNWQEVKATMKQLGSELWNSIVKFVSDLGEKIVSSLVAFNLSVINFFKELPKKISESFTKIVDGVKTWATNMAAKAKEAGSKFINGVIDYFKQLPGRILGFYASVFNATKTWVVDMLKKAVEVGEKFLSNIIKFYMQLPGKVLGFYVAVFNKTKTWVTDMLKKATEVGKQFLAKVSEFFNQLPHKVGYFIGLVLGSIIKWNINMVNKAKELGKKFLDAIVSFFKQLPGKVKSQIDDVWGKIKSWATNMTNKATELGKNFIKNVIDYFKKLPGKVKEQIDGTFDKVKTWVTNMSNKAAENGKNFINNTIVYFKQLPGKVKEQIDSAFNNIKTWATNMANKATENGKNFVTNTNNAIKELPGKIKTHTDSAYENTKSWVTNMANKATDAGKSTVKNVSDNMKDLPDKVSSVFTKVIDKAKAWVTDMGGSGKNAIDKLVSGFTNKYNELHDGFMKSLNTIFSTNVLGKAKTWVENMKKAGGNAISGLKSAFIEKYNSIHSNLMQDLNTIFNNNILGKAKTWVDNMGAAGRNAINHVRNGIIDKYNELHDNLMSNLRNIGNNIVSGIWNGIDNAWGWFRDNVHNFFVGIVNGVKDSLGINSPSKVFADEIGAWLPPGIADGFKAAMPGTMNNIQNLIDKGVGRLSSGFDLDVDLGLEIKDFTDKFKSVYNDIVLWFDLVEKTIGNSIDNMSEDLAKFIVLSQGLIGSDSSFGYVGYNGFSSTPSPGKYVDRKASQGQASGSGDTYIFYSPKAIDEIEAAKQLRKAKQDMAEGF